MTRMLPDINMDKQPEHEIVTITLNPAIDETVFLDRLDVGAEGALFASPDGVLMAQAPQVKVVSTVGAGDSPLAGYLTGCVTGLPATGRAKLASVFAWCALEDVRRRLVSRSKIEARMRQISIRDGATHLSR